MKVMEHKSNIDTKCDTIHRNNPQGLEKRPEALETRERIDDI